VRNVGRLDERIKIQSIGSTENDFGEPIVHEVLGEGDTEQEVSAQVIVKSGTEKNEDNKDVSIRNIRFRVRYLSNISETDIIRYRGKVYDIEFLEDQRRYGQTIIHAKVVE
jgi:SPP1 family predicted phage head-tail adaptor